MPNRAPHRQLTPSRAEDTEGEPHPPATTVAAEAAAAHRTALALSRWCSGDTAADLRTAAALHPGPQAQWHAALQRQFCAWLEAGGFAAQERQRPTPRTDAPMKTAALRRCSQPHCGTIDEELKFSLLRIRDAVE
ncbi:hypothetical protein [Rugamonas apoptosis]|uniref:hypothetical protein n=1 Tax=Rugamonas apoptosis TaxID=2758570 RepID=UPI001C714402|nr:hypothetical protein [Rugamonas apoptosis]